MSLTTFSLDSCQFWGLVTISKQRSCDSLSKGGGFFYLHSQCRAERIGQDFALAEDELVAFQLLAVRADDLDVGVKLRVKEAGMCEHVI